MKIGLPYLERFITLCNLALLISKMSAVLQWLLLHFDYKIGSSQQYFVAKRSVLCGRVNSFC